MLKPGNQLWQWQKENEIVALQKAVMDKINKQYKFPITIGQIETKPQIFNIYPHTFNDKYITMIRYYSQISNKDTFRLRKENLEIQKVIGEILKGIDLEKEFIAYRASNEMPDGTPKNIEHFGFVQKLKENN